MAQPLRKSLVLEVLGEEIAVEVDFRLIEIMERAFNQSADVVVAHFINIEHVQRRHVADVVAELLGRKADVKFKRAEIREFILTAPADAYYSIAAQLQTALMFTLRHATGEEYDKAMADLAAGSKKKTEAQAEDSSASATK